MINRSICILLLCLCVSYTTQSQIKYIDDVKRCDNTINSESDENCPLIDEKSNTLFFARMFDKKNKGGFNDQDIFTSTYTAPIFSERIALSSLNSKLRNAVVGISADGKNIYLSEIDYSVKVPLATISMAEKKGSKYGTPKKMEIPDLKCLGGQMGFFVSADEKVLFISMKDKNSFGEEDLYISTRNGTGWTSPVNLGASINTAASEISPFLSKNQDTLYFASKGHQGLGDYDIFYSVRKGSWTSWSKPVHLGGAVNTNKSDSHFSYVGNSAFWSSDFESEAGDIFTGKFAEIPLLTAKCQANNASIHKGSDGSVFLDIEGGLAPYQFAWSNGSTDMTLMNVSKGEYSVEILDQIGQKVSVSCFVDEPAPVVFEPVETSSFKNLEFMHYFNYNENKLTVSRGELKKLVKEIEKQLKEGRGKVTINIYSSASHVPTSTYESNDVLTKLRAENMKYDVANYFNSKSEYAGKVNVSIVTAIVDGPEYIKDFSDKKKYKPYQFVGIKTE